MARTLRAIDSAVASPGAVRPLLGAEGSALIGASPAMQRLRNAVARVAPIPSPVLIAGESGSGKELVAHDLHRLSGRQREPFVAVNCAALPESLVESELFGHERGAFTGAHETRRGAFEAAGNGTVFLDEIGELPPAAQATLLRVLEERAIVRLGATRPVSAPARVLAATHRNLDDDAAAGRFRHDLLFRINAHVLHVPPLRDHLSDLPELAGYLLKSICASFGVRQRHLDPAALERLASYDWRRNNVRELRNVLERMVIDCEADLIGTDHVPPELATHAPRTNGCHGPRTFVELRAESERRIIVSALDRNRWHITRTATELGLADHASLLKIMRRLNVRSEVRGPRSERG